MPRQKQSRRPAGTGSIVYRGKGKKKRMYLRTRVWDPETQQYRDKLTRICARSEGTEVAQQDQQDLKTAGIKIIDGARMTFSDLAERYQAHKLIAPRYVDDRKVAGLRSYLDLRRRLKVLTDYFGPRRLREITYADLEKFKITRLTTPKQPRKKKQATVSDDQSKKQRSIASVNRELALLRAMLNFAEREGWILANPFLRGPALISTADERRRERILSREEETRLLAACIGPREHLKPLLIAALDTGMRRGEIFKLTWADIDLDARTIHVRATTTKTLTARTLGMTARLATALAELQEHSDSNPASLVFGITDTVRRSFATACRLAGIKEFRLHDCRHTAITRMIRAGMPPAEVMKLSGHTHPVTFARYVNTDQDTAQRASAALDALEMAECQAQAAGRVN